MWMQNKTRCANNSERQHVLMRLLVSVGDHINLFWFVVKGGMCMSV